MTNGERSMRRVRAPQAELDRRIRQLAAALDLTFGEGELVH